MKFEINNLDEIVAEIKNYFKANSGKVIVPQLKEVRNVLENAPGDAALRAGQNMLRATPGNTTFACFQGSQPISPTKYKELLYDAFSKGSSAEIEKLTMVELRYLKKYYKDEYNAWASTVNESTPWSGPKSILSAINKELKSTPQGGGSSSVTFSVNEYQNSLNAYSIPGVSPIKVSAPVSTVMSSPISTGQYWEKIAGEFADRYLDETSPDYIKNESLIRKFESTKIVSIDCIDSQGEKFAIQGNLFYNVRFKSKKFYSTERPPSVFRDKGAPTAKTVSIPSITAVNVGHSQEGASQSIYYNFQALEKLRDTFKKEQDPDSLKIAQEIDNQISILRPQYERALVADRIIFDQSAVSVLQNDPTAYDKAVSKFYQTALALGVKELLVVAYNSTKQDFELRTGAPIQQHFELNSNVFFLQDEVENTLRGGGRSKSRRQAILDAMSSITIAVGKAFAFMEGSSSPVEQALLKALQESLGPLIEDKAISKKIVKRKRKQIKLINAKSVVKVKKADLNKSIAIKNSVDRSVEQSIKNLSKTIIAKGRKELNNRKNRSSTRVKGTIPLANTQEKLIHDNSVVGYLNDRIRESVIKQMGSPSLENRTGRFASSVKITSVTERAINYSYARNPYGVFSRRIGKSPWNDEPERDPHKIIQKAIRAIVSVAPDQNIQGNI